MSHCIIIFEYIMRYLINSSLAMWLNMSSIALHGIKFGVTVPHKIGGSIATAILWSNLNRYNSPIFYSVLL